ncbi:hypothetical protein MKW98_021339 [Papaver atlanticum]|uniref:Uncharacterized protein n=1 Tax=Papaver atlanticum TaxID=357466 RepID=A0AAD4SQW4_9MAGN|nr:hypothetical protein MKW98_021339 [Papaver atlanticum]
MSKTSLERLLVLCQRTISYDYIELLKFGSRDTPLVIECFDFNSNVKHELIGCMDDQKYDMVEQVMVDCSCWWDNGWSCSLLKTGMIIGAAGSTVCYNLKPRHHILICVLLITS